MHSDDITGIVLAGGKSSRMGLDKSLLVWKGKAMVSHAIEHLRPVCGKVVISSNNPVYDFTGCETWPDELPLQAPVAGIYSCIRRSETEINVILSCDMPFAGTDLIKHLLDFAGRHPIVVPEHDNLIEPLCAIYSRSITENLATYIGGGEYSLYRFINSHPHLYVKIDNSLPFYHNNLFLNINTPQDLDSLKPTFNW